MLKAIFPKRISAISNPSSSSTLLAADLFMRTLMLERKRTERSGRAFILMILDAGRLIDSSKSKTLAKLLNVLQLVRDTDVKGWYKEGASIGVIFTELGGVVEKSAVRTLAGRVTDALYASLSIEEMNELQISFHVFPEDWD